MDHTTLNALAAAYLSGISRAYCNDVNPMLSMSANVSQQHSSAAHFLSPNVFANSDQSFQGFIGMPFGDKQYANALMNQQHRNFSKIGLEPVVNCSVEHSPASTSVDYVESFNDLLNKIAQQDETKMISRNVSPVTHSSEESSASNLATLAEVASRLTPENAATSRSPDLRPVTTAWTALTSQLLAAAELQDVAPQNSPHGVSAELHVKNGTLDNCNLRNKRVSKKRKIDNLFPSKCSSIDETIDCVIRLHRDVPALVSKAVATVTPSTNDGAEILDLSLKKRATLPAQPLSTQLIRCPSTSTSTPKCVALAPSQNDRLASNSRRSVDANMVKIPLANGWRRRTCIRSVSCSGIRGDVLYYSPCGRKFASVAEISRYLKKQGAELNGVLAEYFTFSSKVVVGEFFYATPEGIKNISEEDTLAMIQNIRRTNWQKKNNTKRLTSDGNAQASKYGEMFAGTGNSSNGSCDRKERFSETDDEIEESVAGCIVDLITYAAFKH